MELNERLGNRYVGTDYKDLIGEVKNELLEAVQRAHQAGIENDRIILDPGIGFGKTVAQNLELIDRLAEIKALGYPVLLRAPRASPLSATPSTCRPTSAWRARPPRWRSALPTARISSACTTWKPWCVWRA